MSLTKRLCFDQMEADAPETRIANVNRHLALALSVASDCESPDYETLDTIARTLHEAQQELNALAALITALESTIY